MRLKGFDGSTVELVLPRVGSYYARELAPVCILWIVLQLIFSPCCALVAEGNDDGAPTSALVSTTTMITSTTVGFGDVPLRRMLHQHFTHYRNRWTARVALSEAVRRTGTITHINQQASLRKCDPTLMAELHDRYRAAA